MSSLITNATIQIRRDTASNWTSNNPTPADGEWCRETDTGNLKQGDGSTAWNDLGYNISLPETYNIASANTVIALSDITGSVQRQTYYWTAGDGSHTFSFTVSDASTIGGIAATLWVGEGVGHITIESDGSNWQVREYDDYLTDGANQKIWKSKDGFEKQKIIRPLVTENITTVSGNLFISTQLGIITRFHTFLSVDYEIDNMGNSDNNLVWAGQANIGATITATSRVYLLDTASGTFTGDIIHEAIGRWRT